MGPNKKRSLLRLTWLNFLRAGGRLFFFLLNTFYMQIRYATLYFTVTLVLAALRCCQSHPATELGRVCVLDGWPRRPTCNEIESAVSSFFGSSSAWFFSTMMWKKDMAPVFSCFVRSLELKSKALISKTRYLQAQPATPRAMWHPRPQCRRRPLQKGFLTWGSWQILSLASP